MLVVVFVFVVCWSVSVRGIDEYAPSRVVGGGGIVSMGVFGALLWLNVRVCLCVGICVRVILSVFVFYL